MTRVDHKLGNDEIAQFQNHQIYARLIDTRSCIKRLLHFPAMTYQASSILVAELFRPDTPTTSSSAIIYRTIASVTSFLIEALMIADQTTDDRKSDGHSFLASHWRRGCLRRMSAELHGKAADEIRLHQELFGPIAYRSICRLAVPRMLPSV